jgi:hypothetical protein
VRLELFVLEVALVDIVSRLKVKVRPVHCAVEKLMGISLRDLPALSITLDNLVHFLEPQRKYFGVFVAQLPHEPRRFGEQVTAEELIACQRILEILSHF